MFVSLSTDTSRQIQGCEYVCADRHTHRRGGMPWTCTLSLWLTSCERRVRDGVSSQRHLPTAGIRVSSCGSRVPAGSLTDCATCSASLVAGIQVPSGLSMWCSRSPCPQALHWHFTTLCQRKGHFPTQVLWPFPLPPTPFRSPRGAAPRQDGPCFSLFRSPNPLIALAAGPPAHASSR